MKQYLDLRQNVAKELYPLFHVQLDNAGAFIRLERKLLDPDLAGQQELVLEFVFREAGCKAVYENPLADGFEPVTETEVEQHGGEVSAFVPTTGKVKIGASRATAIGTLLKAIV